MRQQAESGVYLRYAPSLLAIAVVLLAGCARGGPTAAGSSHPPLFGGGAYAGTEQPQPLPAARIAANGVTFAAHTGSAPNGNGVQMLAVGQGVRITDPASIRIAYAAQTWRGDRIHDSWADRTLQEPLTADAGTKYLTLYLGHATVGTAVELLLPPGTFLPSVKQVVLLVAQLTAGN